MRYTLALVALALSMFAATFQVAATPEDEKKLPEGQSCSNTFDAKHKCSCMADMKCPMKKPAPCTDDDENCAPPENGPDSTKCISPYCKKDACKCANPCKS